MKKLLLLLIIAISFICCGATKTYTKHVQQMIDASVTVHIQLPSSWVEVGAGVVTLNKNDEPIILTARHMFDIFPEIPRRVCSMAEPSSCMLVDPSQAIMAGLNPGPQTDWWVHPYPIELDGIAPARPRYDLVPIGSEIWTVGVPNGRSGEVSRGIITNQSFGVYYVDARTLPGSSGGGVFDKKGRLVGIVCGLSVVDGLGPVSDSSIIVQVPYL